MNGSFSWAAFDQMPVVGILRNIARKQTEIISELYLEAGLSSLEVTMNSKDATKIISSLAKGLGEQLNIGAGTVCTLEDLEKALDVGAQFIVTPIMDEGVIRECVRRKVPVFAGAYTPTEIYKTWHLGASMVKVFPASQLGPAYIKEVLAPLNHVKLMPTGGISIHNFSDFLKAGACGLGMGSQLIPGHLVESEQWAELRLVLSGFVKKYQTFKKTNTDTAA